MTEPNKTELTFISVKQKSRTFYLLKMPAKLLVDISYVAIRGRDDEPGSVQRILNRTRIASLKSFTKEVGDYPGAIVLNWTANSLEVDNSKRILKFTVAPRQAQIIDGQHRVAGIAAALEEDARIGNLEVPTVIYQGLSTEDCANIFLSINTEQKQVPKSLVFDLYGIASETLAQPSIVRARDIVLNLNEKDTSAYYKNIKMPGDKLRKGGIALSTAVSAIKPLVEEKGTFEAIGITELEVQSTIIDNFFNALKDFYNERRWEDGSNAFQYASGFIGAIDFLMYKLIPFCANHKKFSVAFIRDCLDIPEGSLILQEEIKGLGGKDARKKVFELLCDAFKMPNDISQDIEL